MIFVDRRKTHGWSSSVIAEIKTGFGYVKFKMSLKHLKDDVK